MEEEREKVLQAEKILTWLQRLKDPPRQLPVPGSIPQDMIDEFRETVAPYEERVILEFAKQMADTIKSDVTPAAYHDAMAHMLTAIANLNHFHGYK